MSLHKVPETTRSVFRVLAKDKKKGIGTAFLVHDNILLTCAHVVSCAQTKEFYSDVRIGSSVWVKVPEHFDEPIEAEVIAYRSIKLDRECDFAFLKLKTNSAIVNIKQLVWYYGDLQSEMSVSAYGYREGYSTGGWPDGTLGGPNNKSWWHMVGLKQEGVAVDEGMSGSPVWDDSSGLLIGMLTEMHPDPRTKVTSLIPFNVINKHCPKELVLPIKFSSDKLIKLAADIENMDFEDQSSEFRKNVKTHHAMSFVVHGEPQHGHDILTPKLLKKNGLKTPNTIEITIGYEFLEITGDLSFLHQQIRRKLYLGGRNSFSSEPISKDEFFTALKFNDMVIRIDIRTNNVKCKIIEQLFDEFWNPLASEVCGRQPNNYLLLLIVYYGGHFDKLELPAHIYSNTKLLSPLPKFNADLIAGFISNHLEPLNLGQRLMDISEYIAKECHGGIPEFVVEKICLLVGTNWSDELVRRLQND